MKRLVLAVLAVVLLAGCEGSANTDFAGEGVTVNQPSHPTPEPIKIAPITIHINNPQPAATDDTVPASTDSTFNLPAGAFSPMDRYQLALSVGFTPPEALIATAISLSEDPNGLPGTLGAKNPNGTYDIGLMQINSVNAVNRFGGVEAMKDPVLNMKAALTMYRSGGWFQWCTFPGGCGGGPGSPAWAKNLATATAIAAQAGN